MEVEQPTNPIEEERSKVLSEYRKKVNQTATTITNLSHHHRKTTLLHPTSKPLTTISLTLLTHTHTPSPPFSFFILGSSTSRNGD